MKNKKQKKTEKLHLELLKMDVARMRLELYRTLSEEKEYFEDKPIFDKDWLKKEIFGKNNKKMFNI